MSLVLKKIDNPIPGSDKSPSDIDLKVMVLNANKTAFEEQWKDLLTVKKVVLERFDKQYIKNRDWYFPKPESITQVEQFLRSEITTDQATTVIGNTKEEKAENALQQFKNNAFRLFIEKLYKIKRQEILDATDPQTCVDILNNQDEFINPVPGEECIECEIILHTAIGVGQIRSVFNEPYQSVVNNALKGIPFDADAIRSTLLMAKTEDGQPITTNDIKDLSMIQFAGMRQSFNDYLKGINATTAKAYLEADPNWKSRLVDIDGDGEINPKDDYLDIGNFGRFKDVWMDKDSSPDAYANTINAIRTDKNAFVDFVVSELEKTHDKYAPPTSTGNTSTPPPVKLTQSERNSKAFINKILTNQPSASLGPGYPTWRGSAVDLGHDDMTPFYHTPLLDENDLVIGYDIKTVYELNADFGGSQALGWDEETFGPVARFDEETKKEIENKLLSQNPDYQARIKQKEEEAFTTERETFTQNVFSSHPKFTEGEIGTNTKHEQKAVNFFATRYPGITYKTKRDGVDKIFASFGNESITINLDIENYGNELKAFETWYENNKPIIE